MTLVKEKPAGKWVQYAQRIGLFVAAGAYVVSALWVFFHASTSTTLAPDAAKLTIGHYQLEDGYREGMAEIIDRYEKMKAEQGVNVKITQSAVPSRAYMQWFRTQLVAGNPADVLEIWTADFVTRYATTLNEYAGKPNPYNQGTPLEGMTWEDSLLGFENNIRGGRYVYVYTSQGVTRLFGNLDLLEKTTGQRKMPETLSEWIAMCEKIEAYRERTGEPLIPVGADGFGKRVTQAIFNNYMSRLNQELTDDLAWNGYGPTVEHLWQRYVDGELTNYADSIWAPAEILVELGQYFPDGFVGLDYETVQGQFMQGLTVFLLAGTMQARGLMENVNFEIGISHLPTVDENTPWHTYYDGEISEIGLGVQACYMVPKTSRNRELAVDFLQFMTSYEMNQLINASCRWLPLVREARYDGVPESFRPRMEGNSKVFQLLGHGDFNGKMMQTMEDLIMNPTEPGPDGRPRRRNVRAELEKVLPRYLKKYKAIDKLEALHSLNRSALMGHEAARSRQLAMMFRPHASDTERRRARALRDMLIEERSGMERRLEWHRDVRWYIEHGALEEDMYHGY